MMSVQGSTLGQRLRHARLAHNLSQEAVAGAIDASKMSVSRWEHDQAVPQPHYRELLCRLFRLSAEELFGSLILPPPEQRTEEDHGDEKEHDESVPFAHPHKSQQTIQNPSQPSRESRMLAALSYLFWWISGLPLLFLRRQDTFVLFHSLQSALLFGAITILEGVCLWLMNLPLPDNALLLFVFLFIVLNAVALPAWIVGIVQAWRGNYSKLPFVGEICEKLANALD